jgi:hypothetical protein
MSRDTPSDAVARRREARDEVLIEALAPGETNLGGPGQDLERLGSRSLEPTASVDGGGRLSGHRASSGRRELGRCLDDVAMFLERHVCFE